MSGLLEAALHLAGRQWPIFRLSGSKKPLKGSHGFKDATTDRATIEAWWTETPWANIGLATEAGAVRLVVFDCDGPGGLETLRALAAPHGGLDVFPTLTAKTSRGWHLYYSAAHLPEPVPGSNQKRQKGADGLDIKARGGYVVAPPSVNQSTGFEYRWESDRPIAPLPAWLHAVAVGRGRRSAPPDASTPARNTLSLGPAPAWIRATYGSEPRTVTSMRNAELPEFLDALRLIAAGCDYDTWYIWGACIHDFDPGPNGLAILQAWAATSSQHRTERDSASCARKWLEYKKPKEGKKLRTRASIYKEARRIRASMPRIAQQSVVAPASLPGAEPGGYAAEQQPAGDPAVPEPSAPKVNGVHALPAALQVVAQPNLRFIDFDADDQPRPTTTNAGIAIQNLGVVCRKDVFHEKMLVGGHPIAQWAGDLSDDAVLMLRRIIKTMYGFDPGEKNTRDASIQLCLQHQFNPVTEYLAALQWDGVERIGRWVIDYLGAADTPLNREIGRLWLLAAVRRARSPGTKFDQIIVLEGQEGTGKSSAIKVLAGEDNFSDQHLLGASDKEQQEAATGVWLHEIAELAGMRRTDVERIKQFASRTEDRARPAYGRIRVDMKRRGIFIATTNERAYLKSETGNRRFWPLDTGHIALAELARDRDQLWAEAARQEAAGASIVLARGLWEAAAEEQTGRLDDDPWQPRIMEYITSKTDGDVSLGQVLEGALQFQTRDIGQIEQTRAARVLMRIGMKRYRASVGKPRPWRYRWDSGTSGPA